MRFMFIHTVPDDAFAEELDPETAAALTAWHEEMDARGICLDGARMQPPSTAKTVRVRNGETVTLDGPFAETKEQVAGYCVMECADLDEALAAAAAHPTVWKGSIEVRPFEAGMPVPEVGEIADGKQRYLMLVVGTTESMLAEPDDESFSEDGADEEGNADIDTWLEKVADIRLYGWALRSTAYSATVRTDDGKVVTLDGPYAETKEQIAGFDLLECTDLDEALAAAAAHPVGTVEVRPLWS